MLSKLINYNSEVCVRVCVCVCVCLFAQVLFENGQW